MINVIFLVNCGVPRSPGNGTIANYTGTLEGSTLFYWCNRGFSPQGVLTAVCTANGNWIPDPADVTCRELGIPLCIVMHIHIGLFVINSSRGFFSWLLGLKAECFSSS